jgi:urease subunit beta
VTDDRVPGEIVTRDGAVMINADREAETVEVANTGARPVQVGSHFHFFEANAALAFDRGAAYGMRLDVPAGTAVRFEPGDRKPVDLVAIGGNRRAHGMNGLANGSVDGGADAAVERARAAGYRFAGETGPTDGDADDGGPGS